MREMLVSVFASLLLVLSQPVLARATPQDVRIPAGRELPISFRTQVPLRQVSQLDLEAILPLNIEKLAQFARQEEARLESPTPYKFATPIETSFDVGNSGNWEEVGGDGRLWRLRMRSDGATSLSVGFQRFNLPDGAKLWLYGRDRQDVRGPYTFEDKSGKGRLFTPVVRGDELIIEVFVPNANSSAPDIEISKLNVGYRDFLKPEIDKSGSCNNDVTCPEAVRWRDQIRAVARYTIDGIFLCTGTLLNNTKQDFRPYFLSAYHCKVTPENEDTLVFYWNYESPICGAQGGGSLERTQIGGLVRASYQPTDFLLIELEDAPETTFNVFYSGWDVSGKAPSGTVSIHHPSGDEKAISFDSDPPVTAAYPVSPLNADHWKVGDWDDGTTEHGSSGACLWDTSDFLCIGQLHGGNAACGNESPDWFGKLSVSWDGGGTPVSRLKDWLDPLNTGHLSLEGVNPK